MTDPALLRLGGKAAGDSSLFVSGLLAMPFREAPAQPAPEDGAGKLARAASLAALGRSGEALALYREIASQDPGCVEAWFRLGLLLQAACDYRGALEAWERAVVLDPTQWIASLRQGMTLAGLGRPVLAASCLERSLRFAPVASEVAVQAALVLCELGWFQAAHAALSALPEAIPGWWERVRRDAAGGLAEARQQAEALDAASAHGALLAPRRQVDHARALLALGRLDESGQVLDRLLAKRPANGPAHLARVALALRWQGPDAALNALDALPESLRQGDGFLTLRASLLQEAGRPGEAAAALLSRLRGMSPAERLHAEAAFKSCTSAWLASGDAAALGEVVGLWLETCEAAGPGTGCWAHRFAVAARMQHGGVVRLHGDYPSRHGAREVLPIVQFWGDRPPPDVAETMASWPALNPGVPHLVFDAPAARDFIAGTCGDGVLGCFDAARHPAMQADIFRLAYLARRGGIYADADELCRRPLDEVQAALRHVSFAAGLSVEVPPYVHNSFLAARRECPVIVHALDDMVAALERHREAGREPDIWQVTGPGLITRAVARFLSAPGMVMLLSDQEYAGFAGTVDLAYKATAKGNWRLA